MRKSTLGVILTLLSTTSLTTQALTSKEGHLRWPGAIVPYDFSPKGYSDFYEEYCNGVWEWENKTDIDFIYIGEPDKRCPWDNAAPANPEDFPVNVSLAAAPQIIPFVAESAYCKVSVTGYPKPQFTEDGNLTPVTTSAQLADNCTNDKADLGANGTLGAMHELGHILSFAHEQSRVDARKHIEFAEENLISSIPPALDGEWKTNNLTADYLFTDYDYLSVMHYHLFQGGKPVENYDVNEPWNAFLHPLVLPDEKVEEVYAKYPNFQADVFYRDSLSEHDIEGFQKVYAKGIADMKAYITKDAYCTYQSLEDGECDNLREMELSSKITNHGPWTGKSIRIVHTFADEVQNAANELEILSTTADTCSKQTIDICDSDECSNASLYEKLLACEEGSASSCATQLGLVCNVATMDAPSQVVTKFRLVHPERKKYAYGVAVISDNSNDDVLNNNSAQVNTGSYTNPEGSPGCSTSSGTAAPDPTLPATLFLAIAAVQTRTRRKKT